MPKFVRGEVYWAELDPTVGSEIKKRRPVLVVSPDDFNAAFPRVIIAPLTTTLNPHRCRPPVTFLNKKALILLDQIRSVDKQRLVRKAGSIKQDKWLPTLLMMLA
jgi:mRNA interferase MazF